MSTRRFFVAAAAALVALNFAGCKDDEEEFEYTFENCVEEVANFTNIQNGDTISTKEINIGNIEGVVLIKNGINDVEGTNLIYMGTSKENMRRVESGMIQLSPFTCYYLESVPCIIHDEDTIYGEKKELKFYSIPKHELALTADYGDGEIAANIHWKLQYYYESEDVETTGITTDNPLSSEFYHNSIYKKHKYYEYKGELSPISVRLSTDTDTTYNKNNLEFPSTVDSCYIKQGGSLGNPDYPAYIYRYWKDGKTLRYYDPIIYDFYFNVNIPIGEDNINVSNTIRSILMDKRNCVCDYEFNIYRTIKIGNKTWTIDDYRGSTTSFDYEIQHGFEVDFCGCKEYLYNPLYGGYKGQFWYDNPKWEGYIKGYHEANLKDWEDLMSYLGVEETLSSLPELVLNEENISKINKSDPEMSQYFTQSGAWKELMSSYGWGENENNYQGSFNALPKGTVLVLNDIEQYGSNLLSVFSYMNGSFIISNNYGGLARCDRSYVYGNIRYVKD